ncbi:MAG: hypothetical protein E6G19_07480 [Actinobacteria bacterium]|nr:MAG: hypothetical protein E6G19_07480 [Actinomycetota bacterium]
MTRSIALGLAAVATALVTAAAVSAGDGKEQIKFNAADQAAARAVVIRRADLGTSGWSGGATKPDLSAGPSCPNYHPKVSDLVLTGAARTTFQRSGFEFDSQSGVLKTRRMVALDWRRSVLAPGAVPCLRQTIGKGLGSNAKVVSFAKLPFPQLSTYAALFRGIISVQAQGKTVRVLTDLVLVGRSRTELTLTIAGPATAKRAISAAERRLARLLIRRARA